MPSVTIYYDKTVGDAKEREVSNGGNDIFWLQNVGYFKRAFLGDLIITPKVIYYLPHTNVEAEDNKTSHQLGYVLDSFFLGYAIKLILVRASRIFDPGNSILKKINFKPELFGENIVQKKLDDYIIEAKKETVDISEFGLPKPLRFSEVELKKLQIGFGKLKFETEFDEHDFSFSMFKTTSVKNALMKNGFANQD